MKKCVIICNPNSGHNDKESLVKKFSTILKENNYEAEIFFTKYSGHAEKIVKSLKDDISLVISLGGDGTFNEIVTGNLQRKNQLTLSHIPLGTANDLGVMFGMEKNPVNNLKKILSGKIYNMDICSINNRPFVYVAGLGKFTNVAYETPRNLKKRFGYFAYLIKALDAFKRKTHLFEMTYYNDGEEVMGLYSFVLICNASRMGGIDFFQDVKLDDGKFEVLLSNISTKKDIIKSLYYVKTSDITKVPGFYFFRTNHIKLKFTESPKKNWCIDGENYKDKSLEFDIKIDNKVKMLLPSEMPNKVFSE